MIFDDICFRFANSTGWQDCIARLLVKRMIKPELEQSIVSIDDVISLNDDEDGGADDADVASAGISATHAMIEKAAKRHLPETAAERITEVADLVADSAQKVVTDTTKMVSFNLLDTQQHHIKEKQC